MLCLLSRKRSKKKKVLPLMADGEFYVWDYQYYDRKYIEESSLPVDDIMIVKEYYSMSTVVPAILDIYQNPLAAES
jgi:hypothetical protein